MATPTTTAADALGGLIATDLADPRVRWRPSPGGMAGRFGAFAGIAFLALWLPHWMTGASPGGSLVFEFARAIVFAMVALSLNILMGYAGQASLGHAAFVGAGAFAGGYFSVDLGLGFGAAIFGSILIGAVLALALGTIALRVRGLLLAIVTIAYQLLAEETLFKVRALTGGGAGKEVPRPEFLTTGSETFGWEFSADEKYVYFLILMLLLTWLFDWRLTSSKAGRAIQALRDDERVAASWGINVRGYKLLAFVLSGGIAGFAGLLYAARDGVAAPPSFTFTVALTFLLMTVVGGLGSRPGVVVGGMFIAFLPVFLEKAHEAWGVPHTDDGGTCTSLPPKALQFLIGLVFLAAAAEMIRHAVKRFRGGESDGARLAGSAVLGLVLVAVGGTALAGSITGNSCMWALLKSNWETFIGAVLLLVTLIQYPGGIAEQFGPVFRWLSFKPLKSADAVTVGGGTAGGGMGARP